MSAFEYKVVPAPTRGIKAKGVRGTDARFASALMEVMNELGAEGWQYQRSDTLPCDSRSAMGKKSTQYMNMLVFAREIADESAPAAAESEADLPDTPVLRRVQAPVPAETTTKEDAPSAEALADEAMELAKSDESPVENKKTDAE